MARHWTHWCPNGCGKCVIAYRRNSKLEYDYECKECGKIFRKEEIK